MRDIREGLKHYSQELIMLQQFRTSVLNEHELYRYQVHNQYELIDKSDMLKKSDYFYSNYQVHLSTVVDIFNVLDLPLSSIEIIDGFDELIDIKYQYCEYLLLWDLLIKKDDFEFFIAMVCISQLKVYQDNLIELQNIVKRTLKNKGFKIPNFKPTVFIAMSFDVSLKDVREKISKVIEKEGFLPLLIDSKEHNNQIVPEIFAEIDKAKFMIADLTHHKTGVYYEAGYAKGKEKDVIFTCRKDDFENRHFDVAQTNTIVWETTEELAERLSKRIEAMTLHSF